MNLQTEMIEDANPPSHPLVHSWLNPSCIKRQALCGFGLFAHEKIPAGSLIYIQGGHVMPVLKEPCFPDGVTDLAIQISDNFVLGTKYPHEIEDTDFINHSCNPNAGWKGQIFLAAMRDIAADEEIRFDYAMAVSVPGYGFDCQCGSELCRGRVTSEDWMIPALQERYRGWFQHYLQEKMDALDRKKEGAQT